MGLPSADFETDREQIAAIEANRAPELSTAPTAFAGEMAGALAQLTQSVGGNIDREGKDAVPSTQTSSQGLDSWGDAVGISNGRGGYGRRGATFGTGATGYLTGDVGTVYTLGQQATAGGVTLILVATDPPGFTIPGVTGTGQVKGFWDADPTNPASAGQAGNLPAGTQLTLVGPPPTSDSTITLQTGMAVPGQDQEQDASELNRIQIKMQRPPNGGNGTDYKTWAENALDAHGQPISLVIEADVYPDYYGVGDPLVVVLQKGQTGLGRLVPADIVATIKAYINGTTSSEGTRPVSHDCEVLTGYMPDARVLVCRVRTVASKPAFRFDWDRLTTSYTVFSITTASLPGWATSAGANAVLELQTLAPVSLKDAISANVQPRIQVDTQNGALILGNVVPEQWPALAYLDAAGRTSLALKVPSVPNFATWVQVGNDVYSGGPIVETVGANILATIDGHGPSRISGLADRAQLWDDTVGVTTLSTAAENTLDADGVTRVVARCIAGGVLIGIGPGSTPTVQDVQASDNTINGPEVLRAGRILVTD